MLLQIHSVAAAASKSRAWEQYMWLHVHVGNQIWLSVMNVCSWHSPSLLIAYEWVARPQFFHVNRAQGNEVNGLTCTHSLLENRFSALSEPWMQGRLSLFGNVWSLITDWKKRQLWPSQATVKIARFIFTLYCRQNPNRSVSHIYIPPRLLPTVPTSGLFSCLWFQFQNHSLKHRMQRKRNRQSQDENARENTRRKRRR